MINQYLVDGIIVKKKRGSFGNSKNTHREFVELFGHQCPLAHGPSH